MFCVRGDMPRGLIFNPTQLQLISLHASLDLLPQLHCKRSPGEYRRFAKGNAPHFKRRITGTWSCKCQACLDSSALCQLHLPLTCTKLLRYVVEPANNGTCNSLIGMVLGVHVMSYQYLSTPCQYLSGKLCQSTPGNGCQVWTPCVLSPHS
jgi:hypothetical protein